MSKSPNHMDHDSWRNYTFIDSDVGGIPCLLGFTWNPGCRGAFRDGLQIEPDEKEGVEEIVIMDRRGYHAEWLTTKAERLDIMDELEQQCIDHVRQERADAYEDEDCPRSFRIRMRRVW